MILKSTESSPGKTTKQAGSFLGPIKISFAIGSVHVVPQTGRCNVSGSISSAVFTGVQRLNSISSFLSPYALPPKPKHI